MWRPFVRQHYVRGVLIFFPFFSFGRTKGSIYNNVAHVLFISRFISV